MQFPAIPPSRIFQSHSYFDIAFHSHSSVCATRNFRDLADKDNCIVLSLFSLFLPLSSSEFPWPATQAVRNSLT
jgi:hypothetical protein